MYRAKAGAKLVYRIKFIDKKSFEKHVKLFELKSEGER